MIRGTSPRAFAALAGRRVTRIERRGKWLLWHFDSGMGVLAHLGMTGKFELAKPGAPSIRWSRVRWTRSDGVVVHYRDPRQFGHLKTAPVAALLSSDPLASLGPDALEHPPSVAALYTRMSKSRRAVKEVLMDQTVLAGLGNIQATDALFLARIHPARRADSLSRVEVGRLCRAIGKSLARTLAMNRGDKITYVEESKRTLNPFLIYGKAKEPCPRCRAPLQKMVIGGRTSAFCANCQPRSPAAAPPRARRRQA